MNRLEPKAKLFCAQRFARVGEMPSPGLRRTLTPGANEADRL